MFPSRIPFQPICIVLEWQKPAGLFLLHLHWVKTRAQNGNFPIGWNAQRCCKENRDLQQCHSLATRKVFNDFFLIMFFFFWRGGTRHWNQSENLMNLQQMMICRRREYNKFFFSLVLFFFYIDGLSVCIREMMQCFSWTCLACHFICDCSVHLCLWVSSRCWCSLAGDWWH